MRGERLPALTSLRFFAAAMIVLWHVRGTFVPPTFGEPIYLAVGVSFFFVLSGFILAHVYPALDDGAARARFLVARVARLWPAHVAALIFLLWVFRWHSSATLWPTVANLTMTQAWVPSGTYFFASGVADSWSISCEFAFYLAFLALIPGWRRTWHVKLALALALGIGSVLVAQRLRLPLWQPGYAGATWTGVVYIGPVARLWEFVVGMTAALLYRRIAPRQRPGIALATAIEVGALLAVAVALLRAAAWSARLATLADRLTGGGMAAWLSQGALLAPVFAAFIVAMAAGGGALSRGLAWRPLLFLGEISYEVYLVHQTMISALYYRGILHANTREPWYVFALYLALVLALATAIHLAVAEPVRRMVRRGRAGSRPERRAPPVAPAVAPTD